MCCMITSSSILDGVVVDGSNESSVAVSVSITLLV